MYRDLFFRLNSPGGDLLLQDRLTNGARRMRLFAAFAVMYVCSGCVWCFCVTI